MSDTMYERALEHEIRKLCLARKVLKWVVLVEFIVILGLVIGK